MHRNAPLTPEGRLRLCRMIENDWTVAAAAESMRISRQTAHKWWKRYREAGIAGLEDRSSRPRRCPTKTPAKVERVVVVSVVGDRGLSGAYNSSVLRTTERLITKLMMTVPGCTSKTVQSLRKH